MKIVKVNAIDNWLEIIYKENSTDENSVFHIENSDNILRVDSLVSEYQNPLDLENYLNKMKIKYTRFKQNLLLMRKVEKIIHENTN